MLVFTALIMCLWMGWASPDLSETLALKLLGIVQLGMGGHIASRGVEKVMKNIHRCIIPHQMGYQYKQICRCRY